MVAAGAVECFGADENSEDGYADNDAEIIFLAALIVESFAPSFKDFISISYPYMKGKFIFARGSG